MTLPPSEQKKITAVYSPHPILPSVNRQEFQTVLQRGTLLELFKSLPVDIDRLDVHAFVNDTLIPRAEWDTYKVKEGDHVALKQRVHGGNGDSNPLQIIFMIALIAISIYVPGAMGFAAGTWQAAAVTGAILVGGTLVINAMFPVESPKGAETTDNYQIQGTRNSARIYQPVPIIVGTTKFFPDLAARPYIDQTRDDTYLNQIFNYGPQGNDLVIANTKIADTIFTDYEGVAYQWSDSNGKITLFPGNVDTIAGAELKQADGWVTRTTSANTIGIALDIAGALFKTNKEGKIEALTCELEIQYKSTSSNTWLPFTGTDPSSNLVYAGDSSQPPVFGTTDRVIRTALEEMFRQLLTGGVTYNGNGVFKLINGNVRPYKWTVRQQVEPGTYDVRIRRNTEDFTSTRHTAQLQWAQMKSYQADNLDYSLHKRLALRIRASGQLNGTIDALNSEVSCKIPVWNGSTWVSQVSSNPAYIYLYLARGKRDSTGKRLFGAGMPDSRIDIEQIKEWAAWCDSKGLEFNFAFQSTASVFEMLSLVARCGRATPSWNKGVLGVVYDRENLPVTQVFGPGNIVADSFNVNYVSKNLADEIVIKFRNRDLGWEEDEVRVTVAGTNGANPVELEIPGVTSVAQATKEANLVAARQYYHRRRVSFETDAEGLMVARGDVISISHDLTSWGQGGRLSNTPTGSATFLHLDREIEFTSANAHYIGVRGPDNNYQIRQCVNPYVSAPVKATSVTLTSPLPFNPYADANNNAQDYLFAFDYSATPGKKFKVVSIMPSDGTRVQISAIDEVAEYYASENNAGNYVPPVRQNPGNVTITDIRVTEQFQGYNQPLKIYVAWNAAQAIGAKVQVAVNGGAWNDYGEIYATSFDFDLTQWKVGDSISFNLTPIPADQFRAVSIARYDYSIRGLPNIVGDIELPRITGLELFGQANDTNFGGRDAVFVWRKVQSEREEVGSETLGAETGTLDPYFQDYEIQIFSTDYELLRTEYTTAETYVYTWEKNSEDNGGQAVRSFRISVRYRSKTNQVGVAATMIVSNPAPVAPNPTVYTILTNLYVQAPRPNDIDIAGMEVHVATDSPTFTPNAATLVHKGPEASATIDAGLVYGITYYVKVGFSDGFSDSAVNFSTANTVVPTQLGDNEIQDAINSRYGLFNIDSWVEPPTDPMGSWDLFAGDTSNSSVNITAIGPYQTTSPSLKIVGNGSAGGWYSKWRHPFEVVPERAYVSFTWVRKISANTDRGLYFGFTEDANNIADLNGTGNSLPYFISNAGATMAPGKYYLAVGIIQANTATSNTGLSGLYDPDTGTRLIESPDFKHTDTANNQYLSFGFFSNSTAFTTNDGYEFFAPTAFLMDGGEPSIEFMLRRSYQQGALATLDEVNFTEFASGIEPVELVNGTLPVIKQNSNTILLTSDSKLYRWNGSAYIASVANTDLLGEITETQISNNAISTPKLQANSVTASIIAANAVTANAIEANAVTAGKIAAGAVSADQITANAITANKLAIVNLGMAINRDPSVNSNAWFSGIVSSTPANTVSEFTNVVITGAPLGNTVFQYSGSAARDFSSETIPIDAAKVYRISLWMKQSGTSRHYLTACFLDANGAVVTAGTTGFTNGTYSYWGLINAQAATSWTKYSVVFGPNQTFRIPTNAKFIRIGVLTNFGSTTTDTVQFQDYRIEEVIPGQLVVDGSITAQKITVANLSSMNADMGAVTAGTIRLDTTGWIRSGATGYNVGTGFWLGKDGATTRFYIGSPTKHVKWDGTNLNVAGTIQSTNYVAGSAGYRLLDSGNAEFNQVTVRGSLIANTGNTANVRVEIDPADNFIMWAGRGAKDANTSNAVYYLRANGQAYFGGDILSAFRPRAWARFYGKSSGVFITRQFNIGTATRVAQGRYRFTFATPLPNPYYCVLVTTNQSADGVNPLMAGAYNLSTTGFNINMKNAGGNYRDSELGSLVVFGSDEPFTAPPTPNDPWVWDPDYNNLPPGTQIP